MQQTRGLLPTQDALRAPLPVRFHSVLSLESGESVAALAETPTTYSERAAFGPAAILRPAHENPAKYLAEQIEQIARHASAQDCTDRPLIIRAPIAAFAHSNTPAACEAAVIRAGLCPQEICLEFSDAAFAASNADSAARIRAFRRRGFRVSMDARQAWNTPLSAQLRLSLDTYRMDAEKLLGCAELQQKCEVAAASGMTVIAERARWRDLEWLVDFGVEHAIHPKADA